MKTKEIRLRIDDSKTAELIVMRRLVDEFKNTGLYLESLFTEKLYNWVSNQIKDDIGPDVMEWAFDRTKEHQLRNQVSELISRNQSLESTNKFLEECNKTKDELITQLGGSVEKWKEQSVDLAFKVNQLHEECEKLDEQNTRLKAHLYDLQNKEV